MFGKIKTNSFTMTTNAMLLDKNKFTKLKNWSKSKRTENTMLPKKNERRNSFAMYRCSFFMIENHIYYFMHSLFYTKTELLC
jgi:hypothetical protein